MTLFSAGGRKRLVALGVVFLRLRAACLPPVMRDFSLNLNSGTSVSFHALLRLTRRESRARRDSYVLRSW